MDLHTNSKNFPNKLMLYKRDIALLHQTQDLILNWYVCGKLDRSFYVKDVLTAVANRAGIPRSSKKAMWIEFDYSQFPIPTNPTVLTLKQAAQYLQANVPTLQSVHFPTLASRVSQLSSKFGVKFDTVADVQNFIQNGTSVNIGINNLL